jgi:predicted ATPase/class 3 adenylate cyclase
MNLPVGTATYVFTDIQGSTKLWEESPDAMMEALGYHDAVVDKATKSNEGVSVKPRGEGDSRFLVFHRAVDGVAAAADIQRGLTRVDWPTSEPILVRIAVHTGAAELQSGDYYGTAVNRAARLRALAHGGQTVISAATYELIKDSVPMGVGVRDLGLHGLKDLSVPEQVFQIDIEGQPSTFPPLKSLEAIPNNLPVQLTEFVGREVEIEEVKRGLGESRLLTILAPGGAGKTRLAIQAAADLTFDFPDGVYFVELAPVLTEDEIPQAIFEALGVPIASGDDMRTQLLDYLRSKTQLLILDNFEHLAGGAGLVAEILTSAPQVKVIATSRTKLRIGGEAALTLHGLDTTWKTAEEAAMTSSVQLFVEAALRTDRSFRVGEADLEPLRRVIDLVEGSPLGLLLAAAWTDTLGIEEIADEITNSLDFLESGLDDTPDRHRSMRAVFDYSLSLLGEEERRMFAALSIFQAGFTRDAADQVAGTSLRSLSNLMSKSLVTADRDSGRFSIHGLLRQYAEELLISDDRLHEETGSAYVAFYSQLVAESERLITLADQTRALSIVEDDIENVRSAYRRSLSRRDASAVRRFVLGLWFLYEVRGWHQAAQALLQQALETFPQGSDDESNVIAREAAAGALGKFVAYLGQPAEGAAMSGLAAERLSQTSDRYAELMALEARCDGLAYLGDWSEIRKVASSAIDIADEHDCGWWRAGMPNWLALAEAQLGNTEQATAAVEDGNNRLAQLDDDFFMAWNVMVQASMEAMSGHLDAAAASNHRLVELSRGLGFQRTLQFGLQGLGDVSMAAGDLSAAQDAFLECLAASTEMGAVVEIAGMMTRIGDIRARLGLTQDAAEILACVLADSVAAQKMINETATIGELAQQLLDPLEATEDLDGLTNAMLRGAGMSLEAGAHRLLSK